VNQAMNEKIDKLLPKEPFRVTAIAREAQFERKSAIAFTSTHAAPASDNICQQVHIGILGNSGTFERLLGSTRSAAPLRSYNNGSISR
jgi:hypothetical protein